MANWMALQVEEGRERAPAAGRESLGSEERVPAAGRQSLGCWGCGKSPWRCRCCSRRCRLAAGGGGGVGEVDQEGGWMQGALGDADWLQAEEERRGSLPGTGAGCRAGLQALVGCRLEEGCRKSSLGTGAGCRVGLRALPGCRWRRGKKELTRDRGWMQGELAGAGRLQVEEGRRRS